MIGRIAPDDVRQTSRRSWTDPRRRALDRARTAGGDEGLHRSPRLPARVADARPGHGRDRGAARETDSFRRHGGGEGIPDRGTGRERPRNAERITSPPWPGARRTRLPESRDPRRGAPAFRRTAIVGGLSRTNAVHSEHHWAELGIFELFDTLFVSHETGLVKPDREAFEHAVSRLGCRAEQVLFLDDNQINVDGARTAGLRAERARGVEEAAVILTSHRVL
ncbi:MAG: hypothetical protein CL908_11300 [Deltaproteobacteria bacterium]|nr:hypothetical protein [Deltaproteobacteria bacterium]